MKKYILFLLSIVLLTACNGKKYKTVSTEEEAAKINQVKTAKDVANNVKKISDKVFFAFVKSCLDDESKKTLDLVATWLNENKNVDLLIEGHTDERGTKQYNIALGQRRASAVKKYLEGKGISPARISTISYGKEKPYVVGKGEDIWGKNRRAVVVVIENK